MRQEPYQIFISYAHSDLNGRPVSAGAIDSFVDKVIDQGATDKFQLELTSFLDQNDMRGDWLEFIRENLHESTIFMPILTPKYFMREMCINELATFVAQALESKTIKCIIPIQWNPIGDADIKRPDFNVGAYNYLTRYQIFDATNDEKRDKMALSYDCAKGISRCIDDWEKEHRRSSVIKRLPESLDAYILADPDEVLAKQEASHNNDEAIGSVVPSHETSSFEATASKKTAEHKKAAPPAREEQTQSGVDDEGMRNRFDKLRTMPKMNSSYLSMLYAKGEFQSVNSRLKFVKDGQVIDSAQLDIMNADTPILAITNPDEVDELAAQIKTLPKQGIRYLRHSASLDTATDATNFVSALAKYSQFLREQQ